MNLEGLNFRWSWGVGIPGLETKRNKKLELLAPNFDGESSAGLK